jgi:DNA-binding MarR family transcriptional regulator
MELMAITKEEVLQDLGLSVNEAKVFVALLNIGATTAGKIAEKCKLHRTNVYDSLERLGEKGLVSFILKDDKKLFEAADPQSLTRLVEERRSKLDTIMPQLLLDKQMAKKASAHILEGMKAWRMTLFNLLNYNQTVYMFGIPKRAPEVSVGFIEMFHKTRIARKILMKHIYNENAVDRIKYLNSLKMTEAKYLPQQFNSPVSTIVCGKEILIMHWEEPYTFIRIENEPLADSYKNYFELMYKQAVFPK